MKLAADRTYFGSTSRPTWEGPPALTESVGKTGLGQLVSVGPPGTWTSQIDALPANVLLGFTHAMHTLNL